MFQQFGCTSMGYKSAALLLDFYSVSLIYLSAFTSMPHSHNHYIFTKSWNPVGVGWVLWFCCCCFLLPKTLVLWHFSLSFRINCYFLFLKILLGFLLTFSKPIYQFGGSWHINSIDSSDPWTWSTFSQIDFQYFQNWIFLNFSQQCFVGFVHRSCISFIKFKPKYC